MDYQNSRTIFFFSHQEQYFEWNVKGVNIKGYQLLKISSTIKRKKKNSITHPQNSLLYYKSNKELL